LTACYRVTLYAHHSVVHLFNLAIVLIDSMNLVDLINLYLNTYT